MTSSQNDVAQQESQMIQRKNEDSPESHLSKSLEELSVEPKSPPTPSKSKYVIKPNTEHDYLKIYENFRPSNLDKKSSSINANLPEQIVLVIDRAEDDACTPFTAGILPVTPFNIMRRSVSNLITLKHLINADTQFAIITMNENSAELVQDFTTQTKKLNNCLNNITPCGTEDIFNLNNVFDILQNVPLPDNNGILRVMMFYGRSYTIPQLKIDSFLEVMLQNPHFIVDVLMTHELADSSNKCKEIFQILQSIDKKGLGYFFPVGRNMRRMFELTGRLLGHPLQRPMQMWKNQDCLV